MIPFQTVETQLNGCIVQEDQFSGQEYVPDTQGPVNSNSALVRKIPPSTGLPFGFFFKTDANRLGKMEGFLKQVQQTIWQVCLPIQGPHSSGCSGDLD